MRPVVADHGKRTAGFQYGEDTRQSFGNPVLLGDGAYHGFLRLTASMGVRRFQIAIVPYRFSLDNSCEQTFGVPE